MLFYGGVQAMNRLLSRSRYYLASIPTLLRGVKNWPTLLALFLPLLRRESQPLIELRPGGLRFKVRSAMDVWIIKETCLDRDYERAGVELEDGWIILDIGAGLGDFSVHAAKRHPGSLVFAYEPFPESFALLQENVKLNGLDSVRMFPNAVGSVASSQMVLYAVGAAVQHRTAATVGAASATSVTVASVTLDQIFEEQRLSRCDFLKIDCEGAEYEILFQASDQTLGKIKHICLEYHDGVTPYSHEDLAQFLRDKGFRIQMRPNPVHRRLGFLYAANSRV